MIKIFVPLLFCVLFFGCGFNCRDYLEDKIKPSLIHGRVVNKYKTESSCFGYLVLQQDLKNDTIKNLCTCVVETQKFWDYVLPKDSIYKEKGSLKVTIVRDGNIKEFDYPCCDQ